MATLTARQRNNMPKSEFGLPGGTKASNGKPAYPMKDKSHAANAKARASEAVNAGRMSKRTESKIDAKADRVLGKSGAKKAGEGSAADKKQNAAMRKRTGMTQRQVEGSAADRKADAARAGARTRGAKAPDHLAMAAHHRAMADAHREAADKHVAKAVDVAAKSIGGMSTGAKDGLGMDIRYGGMNSSGLGEAVRGAVARTRSRK